jgi:hypothetical protein
LHVGEHAFADEADRRRRTAERKDAADLDFGRRNPRLPRSLSEVGVSEDRFRLIGENAMLSIFTRSNPQPIREPGDVMQILRLAA